MKAPTVTICSSASFYRQAIDIKQQLEAMEITVLVPRTALVMEESGDFNVDHYKTWFANEGDYHKKAELVRAHFDKVAEGDATLVLNYEKHGRENYIGPNVLMEMALAFYMKKPLFVLNELPADSPFEEELKGMMPTLLHGSVSELPALLQAQLSQNPA